MDDQLKYPPFFPSSCYRLQANIIKAQTSVNANGSYKLASVNGQAGKLGQVSVNLDSQTAIRMVVDLDNERIVNHTPGDIEKTGAAALALEIPNAFDSLLRTTKSASNNYSMSFMAYLVGGEFQNRLKVDLVNDTTSAVVFQAAWVVWGILRRPK